MHLLPQHGWCIQANQLFQMGSPSLCHVDTRSMSRESYIHGACDGCRKGAEDEVETELLYLPPENGGLHPVQQQKLLPGIPCDLCKAGQALS